MFGDVNMPFIFQDDNAPCHRARTVNAWIDRNDIQRKTWPGQSPDTNRIEEMISQGLSYETDQIPKRV